MIEDPREPPKVREVLFVVVAATIADCGDDDEIALWAKTHLAFLRPFSELHFGTPCADWLRVVMNRIVPELFRVCSSDWAERLALHMVSDFATGARLVLAQEAVDAKENECAAIPEILARLELERALVTIDAIACNPGIAAAVTERKGDYLLAVKANQPTLHREIAGYFDDPAARTQGHVAIAKGHGRLEIRRALVGHEVDWRSGDRRYPNEPRFPVLAAIAMVEATVEQAGAVATTRRFRLFSAPLTAPRLAAAVRGHRAIGNSLH